MSEEKVTSSHHPGGMNCLQDCWSLLSLILSCLISPNMITIPGQLSMKCKNVVQYEAYLWGDTMRSILVIPVHSTNPV